MIPMEPGPEDYARIVAQRRAEMARSRDMAHYVHSRTGLLVSFVRALVDRFDPTGAQRRSVR